MCGIFVGTGILADKDSKHFFRNLDNRGPDGAGFFQGKWAFLGLKRLSIIGLKDRTAPHFNENGSISAVVNGEIYNEPSLRIHLCQKGHIFETNTDTEVIVHAYEEWGNDFIVRLNGMFAFIIYDEAKQVIVAGRDRLGIKPLYKRSVDGQKYYSSSSKTLGQLPGKSSPFNNRALIEILYRQSLQPPLTVFQNVYSLLPASLEITETKNYLSSSTRKYWTPPYPECEPGTNLTEEFRDAIKTVALRQSRTERESAIALSGGIDSTLLACYGYSTTAICINVPLNEGIREIFRAESVAQATKLNFFSIPFTMVGKDNLIEKFISLAERPPTDGFNIFYLCKHLPEKIVVLFSGLGADELFHGYVDLTRLIVDKSLSNIINSFLNYTTLIPSQYLKPIARVFNVDLPTMMEEIYEQMISQVMDIKDLDSSEIIRRTVISNYMSPCLLHDADVYSMGQGIELRVPFLDNTLIDLAFSYPYNSFISASGRYGKAPLRQLIAQNNIPKNIYAGPKQGFTLPYKELNNDISNLLPVPAISAIFEGFGSSYRNWALSLFILWISRYCGHEIAKVLSNEILSTHKN